MVKASATGAEDPRIDSRFIRGNFSGSSHTSDLTKIGTPVAALPGAWRYILTGSALELVGFSIL